jgi:hypothetical protein
LGPSESMSGHEQILSHRKVKPGSNRSFGITFAAPRPPRRELLAAARPARATAGINDQAILGDERVVPARALGLSAHAQEILAGAHYSVRALLTGARGARRLEPLRRRRVCRWVRAERGAPR